jgi:hypothetical protein
MFPAILSIDLDGYNVRYSGWNRWLQTGLLLQLPHIVQSIKKEHAWLEHILGTFYVDGVISDNRYGLYTKKVPSVIMTHQLQVQTGAGSMMDKAVQKVHYSYLDKFNETWVVDAAGAPNLGGKLSHPQIVPERSKHIGLLSRFADSVTTDNNNGKRLLVLLSGPEPARSQLSALLWKQVTEHDGAVTFVEGSENAVRPDGIPNHVTYHQRLTDEALLPVLQESDMVICRSGYSTLMDIAALGKNAILIPTPGQTEQEYLGRYMAEQGWYYSSRQAGFDLQKVLEEAKGFPYRIPELKGSYSSYKTVLDGFLGAIS